MNLPKELTTITPLSKTIALIMFITLPIIAFLFGIKYQSMLAITNNSQLFDKNIPSTFKQNLGFINISPTTSIKDKTQIQGDRMVTTDGRTEFFFPKGSFSQKVTLETTPFVGYLLPKGESLWYAGIEAGVKIIQGNINPLKPYTITMNYDSNFIKHLNEDTLSIYFGDPNIYENPTYSKKLVTSLDKDKNIATAESQIFGKYGLLGKLKCVNDIRETQDDNYKIHGGQDLTFNIPSSDLFDIKDDIDWYFINLAERKKYILEIKNTTPGVVPIIELSDDGVSIKQDNKKNLENKIEINTNLYHGYVQIKLSPQSGSKTGCDSTYDLLVSEN